MARFYIGANLVSYNTYLTSLQRPRPAFGLDHEVEPFFFPSSLFRSKPGPRPHGNGNLPCLVLTEDGQAKRRRCASCRGVVAEAFSDECAEDVELHNKGTARRL